MDLIDLLVNESDQGAKTLRSQKKTKKIKLDRENLLLFKNIPIEINEAYTFDLNSKTKFINLLLWTNQFINKTNKIKNLLIGYVSFKTF